jgi:hypothetical protein
LSRINFGLILENSHIRMDFRSVACIEIAIWGAGLEKGSDLAGGEALKILGGAPEEYREPPQSI